MDDIASHPLAGVTEKLKRADENIRNLTREIIRFLNEGPGGMIPEEDEKALQDAIDRHSKREIPHRFGVLAGEVVHHLRSSLDHIVWLLSSETYRSTNPHSIEFPILARQPTTKDEIRRYERKVKGVTSSTARTTIEGLQPYRSAIPDDDPIYIVHNMDRIDKHKELLIVFPAFNLRLDTEVLDKVAFHELINKTQLTPDEYAAFNRAVKMNTQLTTQIAFREFGKRKSQPVIPSLLQLAQFIRDVILSFM